MKEIFANIDAGMTGLIFFFLVFSAIAVWVMWPSAKDRLEAHKYIPLRGDEQ